MRNCLLLFLLFLIIPLYTKTIRSTSYKQSDVYYLVLAGGSGERLWPLSRQEKPKQLLHFIGDSCLLEQSLYRIRNLGQKEQRWVVTIADQEPMIKEAVGHMVGTILTEPCSRNTAAAIIYSALKVYEENPDAVIVFLSSDHYIPNELEFVECIEHAVDFCMGHNTITLLGLRPTYPATGYGYIEPDDIDIIPTPLKNFCEKPSKVVAQKYIEKGYLWNSGMFIGKARVFLEESKQWAPEIFKAVSASLKDPDLYRKIPSISIDYAVMEKSNRLTVLPADFMWSDVGNLEMFLSVQKRKINNSDLVAVDSYNNLVQVGDSVVALVGVNNLCIVKSGGALLIADRSKVEKVKQVIKVLKEEGRTELL